MKLPHFRFSGLARISAPCLLAASLAGLASCGESNTPLAPYNPQTAAIFGVSSVSSGNADEAGVIIGSVMAGIPATKSVSKTVCTMPNWVDAATAAAAAAALIPDNYYPNGCATATVDGGDNTLVHVVFGSALTSCTGPWGLVHLSGAVDLAFSAGGGDVTVDLSLPTGQSLKANGHTVTTLATSATFTANGSCQLSVSADQGGRTQNGYEYTHTGNYTVAFDPTTACKTVNSSGALTTVISLPGGDVTHMATITALEQCGVVCASGSGATCAGPKPYCPTGAVDTTSSATFLGGLTLSTELTFGTPTATDLSCKFGIDGPALLDCPGSPYPLPCATP